MANSIVSIGCECGGPEAAVVGELKVALYQALARRLSATHCEAVDEYAIVLRVDGSLDRFGDEGIARMRFAKKARHITADVRIPMAVWQPMNARDTRRYLARQVRATLELFVQRLQKDGHRVDASRLFAEVDVGLADYLGAAA